MKTIGYVSFENPFTDRKAWSGTIYKIREGLENAGLKVKWVKIDPPKMKIFLLKLYLKLRYNAAFHHPILYKLMANYTDWETADSCDILFFPGGAQIINHSPIKKPYIYYTDACFSQMVNYYWFNLRNSHIKLADEEEKRAIQNASLNIRSSDWARNCAVNYYGDNPAKNFVLEFGANIDDEDIVESQVFSGGQLRILFSGVDWQRKGGAIAVDVVRNLREKYHIDARIMIVGIRALSDDYVSLPFVDNLRFLNKNNAEEYRRYTDVVMRSHLLLLPTRAECSGIVFCEAAGYGLPVFTYDTGGIQNYVENGKNGYRLPLGSTGEDFADQIFRSIQNGEFPNMHKSALALYNDKLSWNAWSLRFRKIFETL